MTKSKSSHKVKSFKIKNLKNLVLIGIVLLLGFFAFSKSHNLSFNHLILDRDENEDELSQTKIPDDVLNAISEAKSTSKPVLGIRADGPDYHIPVLMYHYIEYVADKNDKMRISLNTQPEILDSEIKTLKDNGYTFINASDLANILDGIENPPNKPIILTFDDSYRDFYTYAYPILKKYNAKAVQYIITGFQNDREHLTDDELKEIAKNGLVEIGSHTVHHLALAGLSDEQVKKELIDSKITLEKELGIPITSFAYPYGSFNLKDVQLARQAGFRTALSTINGSEVNNSVRFLVYRLRPGGATGQSLLDLVSKQN